MKGYRYSLFCCVAHVSLLAFVCFIPVAALAFGWETNGIPVTFPFSDVSQQWQVTLPDGQGGCIIVWHQYNEQSTDGIYVQRMDSTGARLWGGEAGLCLRDNTGYRHPSYPSAALYEPGRLIVVWQENANANPQYSDIYAQMIDISTGNLLWGEAKVVCNASGSQASSRVVCHEGMSPIVVWLDSRSGGGVRYPYGQRIDHNGTRWWVSSGGDLNGIQLARKPVYYHYDVVAVPEFLGDCDGVGHWGGAFITYEAVGGSIDPPCFNYQLIAQWVDPNGALPWGENGQVLDAGGCSEDVYAPKVICDPDISWINCTSVYIACQLSIDGQNAGIRLIRLRQAFGDFATKLWSSLVSQETPRYALDYNPQIAVSGNDIVVAWERTHYTKSVYADTAIYATKVHRDGVVHWQYWGGDPDGWPIRTGERYASDISLISNSSNTVLLAWREGPISSGDIYKDIYARVIKTDNDAMPVTVEDSLVCSASGAQKRPRLAGGGTGAAYLVWRDGRSTTTTRLYAHYLPFKREITILNPHQGEIVANSGERDIGLRVGHLASANVTSFSCSLSCDDGATYIPQSIDAILAVDDTTKILPWHVYGTISNACRVKVNLRYSDGTVGEGVSGTFSLYHSSGSWNSNGELVSLAPTGLHDQTRPRMIPGTDMSIIASWENEENLSGHYYGIDAMKFDGYGNPVWTKRVCSSGMDPQHEMAADGAGGAFIAWRGRRLASYPDTVLVQKITSDGLFAWASGPSLVRITSTLNISQPVVALCGDGGAFVAWIETDRTWTEGYYKHRYYRVQKVLANGSLKPGGSVQIASGYFYTYSTDAEPEIQIVADGVGGCYVATEADQLVHHLDLNGALMHPTVGVPFAGIGSGRVDNMQLLPDNAGGVIIVWKEYSSSLWKIRAQKVCNGCEYGELPWAGENGRGRLVAAPSASAYSPRIASGGNGSTVITWFDARSGSGYDIYAQKIDAAGSVLWTENGVPVCVSEGDQTYPRALAADNSQVIVAWSDTLSGGHILKAQRLDQAGSRTWVEGGIIVSGSLVHNETDYDTHALCSDGGGGAVCAWEDNRGVSPRDIYAQKVASSGVPSVPPCAVTYQFYDNTQHQLFAPNDSHHTPFLLGCPEGDAASSDYLVVTVDFDDAYMTRDIAANEITIEKTNLPVRFFYNGAISADGPATSANDYRTTITVKMIGGANDGCTNCTPPSSPSDIPVRLNGETIGAVTAFTVRGYDLTGPGGQCDGHVNASDLVPFGSSYNKNYGQTGFNPCCDYDGNNKCNVGDFAYLGTHYTHQHPAGSYYMAAGKPLCSDMDAALRIEAGSAENAAGMVRAVVSLRNASNLSAAAIGFDIRKAPLKFVDWEPSSDFDGTVMVAPQMDDAGIIFVGITGMENITSGSIEIGTLVFATDNGGADVTDGSVSIAFGEVLDTQGRIMVLGSLDVEGSTPVLRNMLSPNYPNPFNPTTTITYSLAVDSYVEMSIFDVSGARVRTLVNGSKKCGTYGVAWDGTNNSGQRVASGIYICRLKMEGYSNSIKLVLMR